MRDERKVVVVVPCHDEELWDGFRNAWVSRFQSLGWDYDVVWDKESGWQRIENDLGDDAWIIPRRTSAIRSYGYYVAYRNGAETILTLDSDTRPEDDISEHLELLGDFPHIAWKLTGTNRTRGLPYGGINVKRRVGISHGMWTGVPDYDAVIQLSGLFDAIDFDYNHIEPFETDYFPMCGMNLAFTREVAPLMYFGLQGPEYPYDRFDDIWCCHIAQKICRHLGIGYRSGRPVVRHDRASNVMVNLAKEGLGMLVWEQFWRFIDGIQLTGGTPIRCFREVANEISDFVVFPDDYRFRLAHAMQTWVDLFEREDENGMGVRGDHGVTVASDPVDGVQSQGRGEEADNRFEGESGGGSLLGRADIARICPTSGDNDSPSE